MLLFTQESVHSINDDDFTGSMLFGCLISRRYQLSEELQQFAPLSNYDDYDFMA